jgi:hypothetical protein
MLLALPLANYPFQTDRQPAPFGYPFTPNGPRRLLAHSVSWRSATACPESGTDRKPTTQGRTDAIDPKETSIILLQAEGGGYFP